MNRSVQTVAALVNHSDQAVINQIKAGKLAGHQVSGFKSRWVVTATLEDIKDVFATTKRVKFHAPQSSEIAATPSPVGITIVDLPSRTQMDALIDLLETEFGTDNSEPIVAALARIESVLRELLHIWKTA